MSVTSPSQPLALRMLAAYNLTSLGSLDSSLSLIGIQPYLVRCAVAVLVQKLLQWREGSHLLRLLTNQEFPPLVKRAVQHAMELGSEIVQQLPLRYCITARPVEKHTALQTVTVR
jgi:hypothetical protein